MTSISNAGPGEGTDAPENVNTININPRDESYGSPKGEPGMIVTWDGNGYDSTDGSWLMCHADMVCNLDYWK